MLFTQIEFFIFLFSVILLISIVDNNIIRKLILLLANLYFYAYFDYRLLLLLLFLSISSYLTGIGIQSSKSSLNRKFFLFSGISINIFSLFVFKYFNFFIENLNLIFSINNAHFNGLNILLPLGISFYVFRFVSYEIDTYRMTLKSMELLDFLVYATFFPIIVSGPISRASFFAPQANNIKIVPANLYNGFRLFIIGLFLKAFIADRIAGYINFFYDNYKVFNSFTTWIALFSYDLQIYCDFAGYSSMAIGISLLFNIKIEDNFNFPYLSQSIIGFWKRWHITLSEWIKDYIYIPLGGNRKGDLRRYFNLLFAMTLCGLWHGAAWTFVLWGLLHGILLAINHLWSRSSFKTTIISRHKSLYSFVSWFITFICVTICWIFFRSQNISQAFYLVKKFFIYSDAGVAWYHPFSIGILITTSLFHLIYYFNNNFFKLEIEKSSTLAILLCLLWLVIVFFPVEFHPFIYVNF